MGYQCYSYGRRPTIPSDPPYINIICYYHLERFKASFQMNIYYLAYEIVYIIYCRLPYVTSELVNNKQCRFS